MKNILITGGAGFIGSHLVKHFTLKYPNYKIINFDILSYASDLSRLNTIENNKNYNFIKGDINDTNLLNEVFQKFKIDSVINLAAESHVDNSIKNPYKFAETNIMGTLNLLNISNKFWQKKSNNLFYHISTDEVYGELGKKGLFSELTSYNPKSPYSASKASSDHLTRAFYHTFKLPIIISNCSNNYGPDQHSEKLIPLTIKKIIDNEKIPIYGDGKNIRHWLHVEDTCTAVETVYETGVSGEAYNIGGGMSNSISILELFSILESELDINLSYYEAPWRSNDQKVFVADTGKAYNDFLWKPITDKVTGIKKMIEWVDSNN